MQRRKRSHIDVKSITVSAMIAALYVILSYVCDSLGLLRFAVQLRIPEALCVLCAFTPYAIPGMTLGCFLANLLLGCAPLDVMVGSLATFIGAFFGYIIARRFSSKNSAIIISTIPTFISNTLIMPPVIMYAYGSEYALPLVFVTVGIGELLSAVMLGSLFGLALKRYSLRF